jgi:urease subunit alpha
VEGAEPRRYGAHWGGHGLTAASLSVTFLSQAALDAGLPQRLGSRRRYAAASGTRTVRRTSLIGGQACPAIQVVQGDGTVSLGGRVLAARPAAEVPLSRRYLLG